MALPVRPTSVSVACLDPMTCSCADCNILQDAGVRVRLKAMALKGNMHEMDQIAEFCRTRTKDYYRFDPVLHYRYDGDPIRNAEIQSERMSAAEIVALEQSDPNRMESLDNGKDKLIIPELAQATDHHLVPLRHWQFICQRGRGWFCTLMLFT